MLLNVEDQDQDYECNDNVRSALQVHKKSTTDRQVPVWSRGHIPDGDQQRETRTDRRAEVYRLRMRICRCLTNQLTDAYNVRKQTRI